MHMTTVLIENSILLIASGYAFNKHRKQPYLLLIIANLVYMALDNVMINTLDIYYDNYDNMIYYMISSAFFLVIFGLFINHVTGINLTLAGCMLAQSFSCFLMGINGAMLNGATLPEYDIIYTIHGLINSVVWVVEISVLLNAEIRTAWIAITTKR